MKKKRKQRGKRKRKKRRRQEERQDQEAPREVRDRSLGRRAGRTHRALTAASFHRQGGAGYPSGAALAGTDISGSSLPGNVAFVLSFRTANRGRSGRGRNYIGGLNEDDVTGNLLTEAKANLFRDAYSAFLSEALFPYRWVVVSRYNDGVKRAEGLVQTVTTVLYTDLTVDSMRGRTK